MDNINVVVKRAGDVPRLAIIENDLNVIEKILEGPVAVLRLGHDICLLCSMLQHQLVVEKNIVIDENIIHGTIIFTKALQDTFTSLSLEDLNKITKILNETKL
jgi:hypothetical protein